MEETTKKRIDAVLGRVIEPQSLLSVADLGSVSRVTVGEAEKTMVVHLSVGSPRFSCPACSAINAEIWVGMKRRLGEEFGHEFPDWNIEFA